jgi:hypothetical protein
MESSEKMDWARDVVEMPWSSTEIEKIDAVKYLSRVTTGEAMTLLRKLYLAAATEKIKGDLHIKNGDYTQSASAHAARALARKMSPEGRDLLLEKILSPTSPLILKELAIYAFGGVQRGSIWQTLGVLVSDENPHIRRTAVTALSESFSELKASEYLSVHHEVLEELANLAFADGADELLDGKVMIDDGSRLARHLVSRYATDEIEQKLAELMCKSSNEHDASRAAEILSSRSGERPREALKRCLLSRNRPARVYRTIAEKFDATTDVQLKDAASAVVSENVVVRAYTRATARSLSAASERLRAGAVILHGSQEIEAAESKRKGGKKQPQATKLASW